MKFMKKMSKKANSTMGYHKAYLKADAAKRNLDIEKYREEDSTSDSPSSDDDDDDNKISKNVSDDINFHCKYCMLLY